MRSQNLINGSLVWPSCLKPRPRARDMLNDYPIRSIEKLRFADADRNGHVSNAVFAVCCQNARMEILCDPNQIPIPAHAQFVIARLELEFLGEMHWPGTVEIGTRIDGVGRSSVTMEQSLFLEQRCVANARSTVVLIDTTTRRATPLPPETVDAVRALAGSQSANGPMRLPWRRENGRGS